MDDGAAVCKRKKVYSNVIGTKIKIDTKESDTLMWEKFYVF